MSTGTRMSFDEALAIARTAHERVTPHVKRAKAVGSLRRRRREVGDLELLVEPRLIDADLFGTPKPDLDALRAEVLGWSSWVKGGDRMWQVTDVLGVEGVTLDLYFVWPPAEWGSLLAIRTGPWQLGRIAVTRLRDAGTPHVDGHVPGHPTPTEADFFRLAGLECRPPHERDRYAEELG